MNIGILALQGAFREHSQMLRQLGVHVREVRLPADLVGLSGLILPGGESTTMTNLMTSYGFWEPLAAFAARGGAIWGTCAGAILLAQNIQGVSPHLGPQRSLGLLDMTIRRNAFGRQVDSFAVPLDVQGLEKPFPAVFIRAPIIESVGPEVEILARHDDQIVMVQQGRIMATSFHPELTGDTRLHQHFLDLVANKALTRA